MSRHRLCVVHLVRRGNGREPLERFLAAYRRNSPGVEHDLLVLFKGFRDPGELAQCREMLAGTRYRELQVPDGGYDIGSYELAFRRFGDEYAYFCFLNSFSEPLREGWLAHLFRHVSRPHVGLVGATGSNESFSSAVAYRTYVRARMLRDGYAMNPVARNVLRPVLAIVRVKRLLDFPPFPNPHIRTNGFMLSSSVMRALRVPRVRTKAEAYRFESGRTGLTRQVVQMGRSTLVVAADGTGYRMDDWFRSNTFRRSDQEQLLIADNQTRHYQDADSRHRAMLSYYAWRENAWSGADVFPSRLFGGATVTGPINR